MNTRHSFASRAAAILVLGCLCCAVVADTKVAVPDAVSQEAAVKLARSLYKDEFAKAKRIDEKTALAHTLLRTAMETNDDAAGRFALYKLARDLAVKAGDTDTCLAAVESKSAEFDVDRLASQLEVLARLAKSSRLEFIRVTLYSAIDRTIGEAVRDDRYEIAEAAAVLQLEVARGDRQLVNRTMGRTKELQEINGAHEVARKAEAVIEKSPIDPAADLAIGSFYCLFKGDWERGLPRLALGANKALKTLAEAEIAGVKDAAAMSKLADGWWDEGQRVTGTPRKNLLRHALKWYAEAAPQLTGLAKVKSEKRIEESTPLLSITELPPSASPTTGRVGTPVAQSAARAVRADPDIYRDDPYWGGITTHYNWAEWEFDVDVPGKWFIYVLMASADPRPATLFVNGEIQPSKILGDVTSGHHLRNARWIKCGPYDFKHGKNVIKLQMTPRGHGPHIKGFYISQSSEPDLSGISFDK